MPQLDNAPQILKALIDGKDPITGNELPDDSPLQHVKVLRAMLAALQSLERDLQRSAKRALRPTNVGKSWSDQETSQLIQSLREGVGIPDIARQFGRTVRAIQARAQNLGLASGADLKNLPPNPKMPANGGRT
jgi:DNA-binding NarL/FixJ family response regulator